MASTISLILANVETIESIHALRLVTIERLLRIPYDIIDEYEVKPYRSCFVPNASVSTQKACYTLTYGIITLGIHRVSLWPRRKPKDVKLSIEALAKSIREIEILRAPIKVVALNPIYNHDGCCVRSFRSSVLDVMTGIMSPVLESHRTHMAVVEITEYLRRMEARGSEFF